MEQLLIFKALAERLGMDMYKVREEMLDAEIKRILKPENYCEHFSHRVVPVDAKDWHAVSNMLHNIEYKWAKELEEIAEMQSNMLDVITTDGVLVATKELMMVYETHQINAAACNMLTRIAGIVERTNASTFYSEMLAIYADIVKESKEQEELYGKVKQFRYADRPDVRSGKAH